MNIRENIVQFMEEKLYKPMLQEELAEVFEINKGEVNDFYKVLNSMEKEGIIIKTRNDRYGLPEKMSLVVGILQGHEKGYGFVIPEDKTKSDIFIPADVMNGAMHGDKVVARIVKIEGQGKREEGEIIRILKLISLKN